MSIELSFTQLLGNPDCGVEEHGDGLAAQTIDVTKHGKVQMRTRAASGVAGKGYWFSRTDNVPQSGQSTIRLQMEVLPIGSVGVANQEIVAAGGELLDIVAGSTILANPNHDASASGTDPGSNRHGPVDGILVL